MSDIENATEIKAVGTLGARLLFLMKTCKPGEPVELDVLRAHLSKAGIFVVPVAIHKIPKETASIHHFRLTTLASGRDKGDLEIVGTTINMSVSKSISLALHRALSTLLGCPIPE